jgi:hypothetical protein
MQGLQDGKKLEFSFLFLLKLSCRYTVSSAAMRWLYGIVFVSFVTAPSIAFVLALPGTYRHSTLEFIGR